MPSFKRDRFYVLDGGFNTRLCHYEPSAGNGDDPLWGGSATAPCVSARAGCDTAPLRRPLRPARCAALRICAGRCFASLVRGRARRRSRGYDGR